MSGLGENFPRVDGPAKLRGWAQFTADIEMPGMVYAKVLRSTLRPCAAYARGWEQSEEVARRSGGADAGRS